MPQQLSRGQKYCNTGIPGIMFGESIYYCKNDLEQTKRNIDDNRKETIYLLSSHCIDCYFP